MSQSSMAPPTVRTATAEDGPTPVADEHHRALLDALQDPDCRAILEATSEAARSANELSEECDVPLSTAYRKLDLMTDAGLLTECTRIRRSGKHASEYVRCVEDVHISVADDGELDLLVTRRSEGADEIGSPGLS